MKCGPEAQEVRVDLKRSSPGLAIPGKGEFGERNTAFEGLITLFSAVE